MLRNAVIHITNEQPFMADLLRVPAASDSVLICRNVRTMNGKKPVFVDSTDSTFMFPLIQIRFVEVPASSYAEVDSEEPDAAPAASRPEGSHRGARPEHQPGGKPGPEPVRASDDAPGPTDEGFRAVLDAVTEPAPPSDGDAAEPADLDPEAAEQEGFIRMLLFDEELDGDLLRRIREV